MTSMTRAEIDHLHHQITEAFNAKDLDGLMKLFADDAVYHELNGKLNRGLAEIRLAFEPQFRGDFGANEFISHDFLIDEKRGFGISTWAFVVRAEGKAPRAMEGTDVYQFENGRIQVKRTYSEAKSPLFREV